MSDLPAIPAGFTPDVVAQIRRMRADQDFSANAQKKLASYLDEANYPGPSHAQTLRMGLPKWLAAREIALLLGGEYEEAVRLIDHVTENVESTYRGYEDWEYDEEDKRVPSTKPESPPIFTFSWLIESLHQKIKTDDDVCLPFDTPDVLYQNHERLWAAYELVTGNAIPEGRDSDGDRFRESYVFRCSC